MKKRYVHIILLLLLSIASIGVHTILNRWPDSTSNDIGEKLHEVMVMHQQNMDNILETIADSLTQNVASLDTMSMLRTICKDEKYGYYLFHNGQLTAWHNAKLPIKNLRQGTFSQNVIKTDNGWYYVRRNAIGRNAMFALLRIRKHYAVSNDYLNNNYHVSFGIDEDSRLIVNPRAEGTQVKDADGNYLFTIEANKTTKMSTTMMVADMLALVLWFCSLLFMINLIMLEVTSRGVKNRSLILAALMLGGVYVWALCLSVGPQMAQWFIFSPQVFAYDWWAPSLVYLLMFAIFTFVWCYYIFRWFDYRSVDKWNYMERHPGVVFFGLLGLLYWVFTSIHIAMNIMVYNSTDLAIYIENLDVSGATIVKIVILTLLSLSFILVLERIYAEIIPNLNWKKFWIVFGTFSVVVVVPSMILFVWFEWVFFVGFLLINPIYFYIKGRFAHARATTGNGAVIGMTYSSYVWLMFIFALFLTQRLTTLNNDKERQNRELLCNNLAFSLIREDDPVAETLLQSMEHTISNDSTLRKFFTEDIKKNNQSETNIYSYMRERYFEGYFTRYDVQIIPCRGENSLIQISNSGEEYNCYEYFSNLVDIFGSRIAPKSNFYGLNDNDGRASYFGIFKYYNAKFNSWERLYIELNQRTQMNEIGYPELLTNSRDQFDTRQLKGYSYAKYYDGKLQNTFGECSYARRDQWIGEIEPGEKKFSRDAQYTHLIYAATPNQTIVLSYPVMTISQYLADYSYFFLSMFTLSVILLFLVGKRHGLLYYNMSIHERIQSVFVIFVMLLLVVICVLSAGESIKNFESQSNERLKQNISTIKSNLALDVEYLNDQNDQITVDYLLQRATRALGVDVHLYNEYGRMIGTSRRELFDNGIASPLINSEALVYLRGSFSGQPTEGETFSGTDILLNEKLGSMEYYAIYSPLTDSEDNLVGYLCVPYFTDLSAMRSQLMSTLVPITNAYMIVMLLAILFSYFLAKGITKPLMTVSQRIRLIGLQKKNEKIEYNGTDEIALLIGEYNRMTDELEHSAEQLALTEREMTWREMARQIAHEIKNPLTPMKLSVQYMIKAWEKAQESEAGMERFDTFIRKTANTLVEQIDQMAYVASEFSNVAKMKQGEITRVDIAEKLSGTVLLYSKSENATVSLKSDTEHAFAMVNAEQILSVFNNLIKNALQSVGQGEHVDIKVSLEHDDERIRIKVSDNGRGIEEEVREKIFKPNFTTKSTGMGLGLAIVKTIIANAKGEIWFETEVGKGTTFFVELPSAGE